MIKTSGQKSLPAIGFVTITRDAEHGLFGGYLVLNKVGRPLEFHCTAPVRPNRAQEILYGPTLEPYLCGERIGPALLGKSKSMPVVVFTDVQSAMAMRQFVSTPLMLVLAGPSLGGPEQPSVGIETDSSASWRVDRRLDAVASVPRSVGKGLHYLELGGYRLAFAEDHPHDREAVRDHWPQFADQIDLEEPFGRIREAIDEARQSAR